jgi:4-diphosphocytidyl-2-C-methyl-D-erythritol kinase
MNAPVRLSAPAKVTLGLRVTGVRADGYHLLDAVVVVGADIADWLDIETASGPRDELVVTPHGLAPADDSNLVLQALTALRAAAPPGAIAPQRIAVRKMIPMGGGLGGGSADAAAVLRHFGAALGMDHASLMPIAAALGADIAVCIAGGVHHMRGIGDELEAVRNRPSVHLVIATPKITCATPAVYRAWDELGGPHSSRELAPPAGFEAEGPLVNDLEPAAEHVAPGLRAFRAAFEELAGAPAALCGSGSSYACWFATRPDAEAAVARVQAGGLATRLLAPCSTQASPA